MKRTLLPALTSRLASLIYAPLLRDQAMVFMLHRFSDPDRGVKGHSPGFLDDSLKELRKNGFRFVRLDDLVREAQAGQDLTKAISFTVDDGYYDFHRVGAPVFLENDCPVTVFLQTGFLDEAAWQWWDQIRYAMERTSSTEVVVPLNSRDVSFRWEDRASRNRARSRLEAELCKQSPTDLNAALPLVMDQLDVDVPSELPDRYAPLSWEEVRALGDKGISFGPHSLTHPNFSLLTDEKAEEEIRESWARVRSKTSAAVPVFCFPFGIGPSNRSWTDQVFLSEGMVGAVSASAGYASGPNVRKRPFYLPRFPWPDNALDLRQVSVGLERAKAVFRPPKPRS